MGFTLSMVAPVLQDRFQHQLNRKIKEVGVFPPSTLLRVVSLSNHSDRSWDRMTYLIRQSADATSNPEDTPTRHNTISHVTLDTIGTLDTSPTLPFLLHCREVEG